MLHPRGGPCYLLGALFRDKGVSQVLVYLHASSCVRFRLFGSQIPSVLTPPSHRCGECLLESSDRRVCIRVNPLVCFVIQEGLPAIVSHVEAELLPERGSCTRARLTPLKPHIKTHIVVFDR